MKHTLLRTAVPLLLAGAPSLVRAQAAEPAGAAAPAVPPTKAQSETPVPGVSQDEPQAQPEAQPEVQPKDSLDDRLNELNGKVEGLQESYSQTEATVNTLKKLKFSGYVQGRYEWHDDGSWGLDAGGNPRGTNRFFVRRGRLKATYQGDNSEYVLQIDATGDGVALRDAEASLVDTWTPLNMKLTVGQFKLPFGHEVVQSSADREMPERASVIRSLFPGERDRGVRLNGSFQVLRFSLAMINGNFTNDPIYRANDQSSHKDFIGRIGADFELAPGVSWVIGASGHVGRALKTTAGRPASGMTAATMTSYQRFTRLRVGGDSQFYIDVPSVGGLAIKGELIWARDKADDFQGVPADPCTTMNGLGWIATVVQNVGDHVGVVARLDQWDPNTAVASGCLDPMRRAVVDASTAIDKITTVGGGLLWYVSGNLKISAVYEHIAEQGKNKKDNDIFTTQVQSRF